METTQKPTKRASNVRWKCPTCNGGVLAPSRPRMNDIRRYCLPCSAKAGILVQRIAPALEKKREVRAEANRAKAKTKRATAAKRNAPKKATAANIKKRDAAFMKEADRLWELYRPYVNSMPRPKVEVVFTRHRGCSGYWDGDKALIRISRSSTGGVREWAVLAHELCHAAHRRSGLGGDTHGREFYTILRDVTERRWKTRINGWHEIAGYSDSSRGWGYKVDAIIEASLREQGVVKFTYPAAGGK